jgi:hypothetical protein
LEEAFEKGVRAGLSEKALRAGRVAVLQNRHDGQISLIRFIRIIVKSFREKYFSSAFRKIMILLPRPASMKRGERVVTIVRRDAMDVVMPRDERRSRHAAKACGPGAPGLVLSLRIGDVGPSGPTRRDP